MSEIKQTIEQRLQAPFRLSELEFRVQSKGVSNKGKPWCLVLTYVTNRAIQDRLDSVFGCMRWTNEFKDSKDGVVECGIGVYSDLMKRIIWKWDGAGNPPARKGMSAGDLIKGGRSMAMKRTAVQWGVGRYLYKLPASFVVVQSGRNGEHNESFTPKTGGATIWGSWDNPVIPKWAMHADDLK
jgi:hypothetical protein